MRNIGYINYAHYYENSDTIVEEMRQNDCHLVYQEQAGGKERPAWKSFVNDLGEGDCAMLYSFEHTFRNFHDMVFFIRYCNRANVRIVSISDEIDSGDMLFNKKNTSNILNVVCRIFTKRDKNSHDDIEAECYSNNFGERKLKRYRLVINMYKAGYSVAEIMKHTGYRGKSNIYRILHKYEVKMEHPSMSRSAATYLEAEV